MPLHPLIAFSPSDNICPLPDSDLGNLWTYAFQVKGSNLIEVINLDGLRTDTAPRLNFWAKVKRTMSKGNLKPGETSSLRSMSLRRLKS
jgi:hypothetical protein